MISGFLTVILIAEPVLNEELKYRLDQLLNKSYTLPTVVTSAGIQPAQPALEPLTSLGSLSFGQIETIVPVSTDFGVVIEKINANARVIADVNPASEASYNKALSLGVAHAKGTAYPGQKGNIYLFSHSTNAPWNIIRYNAIFYLLNKLEAGDRVVVFYQGRRFDYIVFDKTIASSTDTQFITSIYTDSVLTLQTCDPPGTLLNRLIVRAKLAGD